MRNVVPSDGPGSPGPEGDARFDPLGTPSNDNIGGKAIAVVMAVYRATSFVLSMRPAERPSALPLA